MRYLRVCGEMGVKELPYEIGQFDTKGDICIDDLPEASSIAIIDALVLFHRLSAIVSITIVALLDMMRNKLEVWATAPNARLIWYLVDYPNVTKRKSETQAIRAAARRKQNIQPYPDTTEFRGYTLYDTKTRETTDEIAPGRLAATRHLRHAFSDLLWRHITMGKFPDHVGVFFDSCNERQIPMLNGGRVTLVPFAAEITAEGEVRGVLRALQMFNAYPKGVACGDCRVVPTDVVIQTVDGDAVPLLVEHFWDYAIPVNSSLSLVNKAEKHINVVKFIAKLKADGWTWQMFKAACILSGTDYSVKKHYTDAVGGNVAWQSWRAIAPNVPMEIKTDHRRIMETLICSAYAAKIKGVVSTQPSTRKDMLSCVRMSTNSKLQTHIFNDKDREEKGKDNYEWLWDYWGTLGRNVALIEKQRIQTLGQFGGRLVAAYKPEVAVHHRPAWLWGGGGAVVAAAFEQKAPRPAAAAAAAAAVISIEPEYVPDDDDQELLVASGAGTSSDVAALCSDLT